MHLRKRALAVVFVATALFTAVGASGAMAVPMPWETSKAPAAVTPAPADGEGAFTALCGTPCYQ